MGWRINSVKYKSSRRRGLWNRLQRGPYCLWAESGNQTHNAFRSCDVLPPDAERNQDTKAFQSREHHIHFGYSPTSDLGRLHPGILGAGAVSLAMLINGADVYITSQYRS